MSTGPGYAVIDLETTGFAKHDRIVEVGLVLVSATGEHEGVFGSVINPECDPGPSDIHGITVQMASRAPTFAALAGHIRNLIEGRTVVAHNLVFDARMLAGDFGRVGAAPTPLSLKQGICTQREAKKRLDLPDAKLLTVAGSMGVPHPGHHEAVYDAWVASRILAAFLSDPDPSWELVSANAASAFWPHIPVRSTRGVRREELA